MKNNFPLTNPDNNQLTKQQIIAKIRALKSASGNYVHAEVRADPYTMIAEYMIERLPSTIVFKHADGTQMSFAEIRKLVKKPIMTTFYNSKRQPESVFGEKTLELKVFYAALNALFPGAMKVLEAINTRWDKNADYNGWNLPDKHQAYVPVMVKKLGVLNIAGLRLKYQFKTQAPSKNGTSLAANFIHSMDAFCVRYVVDNADFIVTHVHDQFDAHPNNMGKVQELYLQAIAIIAKEHWLEKFVGRNLGINVEAVLAGMLTAKYHLC